ncbi:hypothetical protein AA0113_g7136 [Alternaria arborescens]|uniref:Uncharacterized protein n=1 Tax=Alternaria arborescens TaxID=156630 RepID=A0A4Q4RSD2_9PLEO|nr:hypothetical protein AA0113_g7136 [Alternaria arborescens]
MPYITDAQTQHGTQLRPTTVVHEPDVRSTLANCSCSNASNGQVKHDCTAVSYVPQAAVAPRTDPAGRIIDLTCMGSQFDGH